MVSGDGGQCRDADAPVRRAATLCALADEGVRAHEQVAFTVAPGQAAVDA
jgi:hypothetical protein